MAKPVTKAKPKAAKANKSGTRKPAAAKKAPVARKSAPLVKSKPAGPPKKPVVPQKPIPKASAKAPPRPAVGPKTPAAKPATPEKALPPKPAATPKPSAAPKPTQAPQPAPPPAPKPTFVAPSRPPEPQRPTPIRLKAPTGPGAARVIAARNLLESERRHDLPALLACFGPDPTLEFAGGPRHLGKERIGQIYGDLLRAFPDLTIDVIGEHASERSVVVEFVMQGTHRQQWLGMAPRGRTLTLPVCTVFLFDKKDQLTAQRLYLDRNLAIVQLTSGLLR